jgi:hypothetical protein
MVLLKCHMALSQADQMDISQFNFIVNPVGGGTIIPTLHNPRTHYSGIPSFQSHDLEALDML